MTMLRLARGVGGGACSAVIVCVVAMTSQTSVRGEPKAYPKATIELFTSQGCSSCPPADKLIGELAHDPTLVTMSLPIDYWDYLGWKDTLALKGHGKRQQAYARVRGDREVYTPQVVINGLVHAPGSDRTAIESAIANTRNSSNAMQLPVKLTVNGDQLTVEIPGGTETQSPAEVWLLPLVKRIPVAIERGENRGHTITYSNVVRRWVKLGEWNGKAEVYNVSLKDFQSGGIDEVAVMVQSGPVGSPGVMLGANTTSLH